MVKTGNYEKSSSKDSEEFRSNLWDRDVKHNEKAEWFKELNQEGVYHEKQTDLMISAEMVLKQTDRIPN